MLNNLTTEQVLPALRFLSKEAHLSQGKLANRVEMSLSAVNRRLSGDTPLSLDDASRMAAALGYEMLITFRQARPQGTEDATSTSLAAEPSETNGSGS